MNPNDPTPFDDFWESSSLDDVRAGRFGARVDAFEPRHDPVHPFTPSGPETALTPVRDRLQRLFESRRSRRDFTGGSLRHRCVEQLLASIGPGPDGRRVIPEAGGLPSVHVDAIARNVDGPLGGRIVRYDHLRHTVADVGPVPVDDELHRLFMWPDPLPAMLVVFTIDDRATRQKYGERGGRFVVQHVGHAAQNMSLRAARQGLRAVVLGGGMDAEILELLRIRHTGARYCGALALGA